MDWQTQIKRQINKFIKIFLIVFLIKKTNCWIGVLKKYEHEKVEYSYDKDLNDKNYDYKGESTVF